MPWTTDQILEEKRITSFLPIDARMFLLFGWEGWLSVDKGGGGIVYRCRASRALMFLVSSQDEESKFSTMHGGVDFGRTQNRTKE